MSSVTVEIKGKEDVSTHAKKAGGSLRDLVQEQNNMVKGFATAAVAGAAVTAAIRQIAQAVDQCVIEFAANERATLAFNAAIKGSGTITAGAGNGLAQFAEEIAIMTGQTGESVQSMETLLVTSGRTEGEVRKLIAAAVDMSAATGTDLNTAVEQLNATFSGTEGRLGKLIPELQGLTKEQLLAGGAVDIIAEKYAGLGDALQDSVDVSIKNYKNAMSDLKAELGGVISLGLTPLREWLTDLVRQWGAATSAARSYATVQKAIVGKDLKALVLLTDSDLKAALTKQQEIAQSMYGATVSGKSYNMGGGIDVSGAMLRSAYDAQLQVLQDIKLELSRRDEEALAIPKKTIPTTTGKTSSTVDPFQALVDSLRKELGPKLVDSGIDDVIASYFEESVSTAFEMIGTGGSSDSGIAEYQSPAEPGEGYSLFGGQSMDPLSLLTETFSQLAGPVSMIMQLLDPIGLILKGFMDVMGPAITQTIQPLFDALQNVGALLAEALFPILDSLAPIFTILADIIMRAVVPLINLLAPAIEMIAGILDLVMTPILKAISIAFEVLISPIKWLGDLFGWVGLQMKIFIANLTNSIFDADQAYTAFSSDAFSGLEGRIAAIWNANYKGSLVEGGVNFASTGSSASLGGSTGSNASYSTPRDITVNVSVTTSALVGDDGIRQFSLMIWREIKSAGVLGAA